LGADHHFSCAYPSYAKAETFLQYGIAQAEGFIVIAALEELRLLSKLQHDNRRLLQMFLVGQEQLLDMIYASGMRHLQQRLIAAAHLEPLDLEETVTYVEHRLCRMRWQGDPAIREYALSLIHRFSAGV
jgi:type II secretory pathway predicted ATPase ExeA